MRIVFAGTPAFAAVHLQALLDAGHELLAVYTQPDRPAGRGKQLSPSAVKALAQSHGLPVHQPLSLKGAEEGQRLADLAPDVMVVVAYGLLLPPAILALPRFGCLNVHASLLPRWRGAAPIERALLAGDPESGVTIMQMDAGLDTGPMLARVATPISAQDNAATLTARLEQLGCQALLDTLERLAREGRVPAEAQDEALATYAAKLSKEEARIDWRAEADSIQRQVQAFFPRSPAWTWLAGERLRLLEAEALPSEAGQAPGTLLSVARDGLVVACGRGCLRVTRLQPAGRKPMSVAEALNARQDSLSPGQLLGVEPPAA